jgi:hypothetical protein
VEPGSAVLDEGRLTVAGVCRTYDKEKVQVRISKGGGKLGAHNTILDQSYVQDHVQLYRDVVERVIRPWDSTPDNTGVLNAKNDGGEHVSSPNRLLEPRRSSVFSICGYNCISRKMSSAIPSLGQAMRRFTRLSLRQSETKSSSRLAAPSSRSVFSQPSRLSTRSLKHSLSSQCMHSRYFSSSAFRRASKVPNRNPFTRSGVRIFLRGN